MCVCVYVCVHVCVTATSPASTRQRASGKITMFVFHRVSSVSGPVLGSGVACEETRRRYTALVCFFSCFSLFSSLAVFHAHKNTSQVRASPNRTSGGTRPSR